LKHVKDTDKFHKFSSVEPDWWDPKQPFTADVYVRKNGKEPPKKVVIAVSVVRR
jgi:hypothetical protein